MRVIDLISRYLFVFILGLGNLFIIRVIFEPLTIFFSYIVLNLAYPEVSLTGSMIILGSSVIEIITSCVAASAYFLLAILIFGIQKISLIKRITFLALSFGIFFILNILRIFFLSELFINNHPLFNSFHLILWNFFSILLVVGIWFYLCRRMNINEVPFVEDIKYLVKNINGN